MHCMSHQYPRRLNLTRSITRPSYPSSPMFGTTHPHRRCWYRYPTSDWVCLLAAPTPAARWWGLEIETWGCIPINCRRRRTAMHGIGERENGKNPGVLLCMYFWGRAPSRRRALMTTKEDGSIESAMKSPSWMGVAAFGTNEKTDSYLVPAWWRDIGL